MHDELTFSGWKPGPKHTNCSSERNDD